MCVTFIPPSASIVTCLVVPANRATQQPCHHSKRVLSLHVFACLERSLPRTRAVIARGFGCQEEAMKEAKLLAIRSQ